MHPDSEILEPNRIYSVLGEIYSQEGLGGCLPPMPFSIWNTTLIRINVIPSVVCNLGRWHVDDLESRSCIHGICSTTMPNFAALGQFLNVF